MQEISENPTSESEAIDGLQAAALRAEAWAGEPFLHEGEDPAVALAAGTARRQALDEALAEIDAGLKSPSAQWKVRFGLMLGLERVLSEKPPKLASGTELRRHQIDALAGMLTELISANQAEAEAAVNGDQAAEELEPEEDEDDLSSTRPPRSPKPRSTRRRSPRSRSPTIPAPSAASGSAIPTASGKTIAAAGFVEAARTLGVLILTHRRLLVSSSSASSPTRATRTGSCRRSRTARRRRSRRRSRSRPTPGSRATSATSPARRTSS